MTNTIRLRTMAATPQQRIAMAIIISPMYRQIGGSVFLTPRKGCKNTLAFHQLIIAIVSNMMYHILCGEKYDDIRSRIVSICLDKILTLAIDKILRILRVFKGVIFPIFIKNIIQNIVILKGVSS